MKKEPIPFEVSDSGAFFHGTKAALKAGALLEPGYSSNYGDRREANYVYLAATLDAAAKSDARSSRALLGCPRRPPRLPDDAVVDEQIASR
jgi:hypothetical protein